MKNARDRRLARDRQPRVRRAFVKGMATAALGLIAATAGAQGTSKKKSASGETKGGARKRLQDLGAAHFALDRKLTQLNKEQKTKLDAQIKELENQLESSWRDASLFPVCI